MKTPLSVALLSAIQWLKRHPHLKADPEILLEFVCAWVVIASQEGKLSEAEARECGIHAVKECAGCVSGAEIRELIEPEDLRD